MKKCLAFLVTTLLLLSSVSVAFAAKLDLSPIEAKTNLYTVDIDEDNESAFIETVLTAAQRSFTHKYESSTLYSTTMFDVLVVDYGKTTNYPIIRLWISYCADDAFQNIDSVTIALGNKQYTFADVSDPDWLVHDEETGYLEEVLIRFNEDNLAFLTALEELANSCEHDIEKMDQAGIKLVLHGDEDIQADLGSGFLLDFLAIKDAWLTLDGLNYIDEASGNDMSMKIVY